MISTITSYKMINHDVLELEIEIPHILPFKPGQRAMISYDNPDIPLKRAYSILEYKVHENKCTVKLAIKLLEGGKGSEHLRKMSLGSQIDISGIYGHFTMQNTDNSKVLIGSGTGIVPLINMAESDNKPKTLYFTVSYKDDLMYFDRIKNIKNLTSYIHVSREQVEGCETGRIDLTKHKFTFDTEFYICGNPVVVNSFVDTLKTLGYEDIYTEKY